MPSRQRQTSGTLIGRRSPLGPRLAFAQIAAGQVLHDREGQVLMLADVGDLDDVGVSQADEGADFAREAAGELRVREHGGVRHLEDHVAVQVMIVGLVDRAHAALSQAGEDLIAAAQRLADPVCGQTHTRNFLRRLQSVSSDQFFIVTFFHATATRNRDGCERRRNTFLPRCGTVSERATGPDHRS